MALGRLNAVNRHARTFFPKWIPIRKSYMSIKWTSVLTVGTREPPRLLVRDELDEIPRGLWVAKLLLLSLGAGPCMQMENRLGRM
jgi:hypothetical protein